MYSYHGNSNGKRGQECPRNNGNAILSGTVRNSVCFFQRNKKKERADIMFWSIAIVGTCAYVAAILLNIGNWKAMTLFLIAALFGLCGLAYSILKIVKKVKEIQKENLEIKAKVQWLENINLFD